MKHSRFSGKNCPVNRKIITKPILRKKIGCGLFSSLFKIGSVEVYRSYLKSGRTFVAILATTRVIFDDTMHAVPPIKNPNIFLIHAFGTKLPNLSPNLVNSECRHIKNPLILICIVYRDNFFAYIVRALETALILYLASESAFFYLLDLKCIVYR